MASIVYKYTTKFIALTSKLLNRLSDYEIYDGSIMNESSQ